ncbi:MAG: CDP-alcohol phosphatidyltransferase family protein [Planctomycetaceae bacterium]|nr:CDP-alcohol phosphatidyltransferase family protein [Planctomycetales bacterium]MCB9874541.1 CDP-alcohol phosphatidyltransferase family protein [Planctomycetaceae bacterium]MCB9941587.1 CDP-alcohol phosphatidyltransferase family protein [Planctomycetaceae bacterium]
MSFLSIMYSTEMSCDLLLECDLRPSECGCARGIGLRTPRTWCVTAFASRIGDAIGLARQAPGRYLRVMPPTDDQPAAESITSLINVPNSLCAIRFLGSFVLIGIAIAGATNIFVPLLAFLLMTDWVDGKLAILLQQQTRFGAKLDTVADVTLYVALLFGLIWLKHAELADQWLWMGVAAASYAASVIAAFIKFGSFPSYHTRAAKTCWFLVSVASIALFAGWSTWPIRVAAIAVTATNLEAIGITFVLNSPQVDLPSIYHAWKLLRDSR